MGFSIVSTLILNSRYFPAVPKGLYDWVIVLLVNEHKTNWVQGTRDFMLHKDVVVDLRLHDSVDFLVLC